jgi:hypothetical protein
MEWKLMINVGVPLKKKFPSRGGVPEGRGGLCPPHHATTH